MFFAKLKEAIRRNESRLCVGLDSDPARLPERDVAVFNRAIIEATADLACAYKPNLAFYEALGPPGMEVLQRTLEAIPEGIPTIADGKRAAAAIDRYLAGDNALLVPDAEKTLVDKDNVLQRQANRARQWRPAVQKADPARRARSFDEYEPVLTREQAFSLKIVVEMTLRPSESIETLMKPLPKYS